MDSKRSPNTMSFLLSLICMSAFMVVPQAYAEKKDTIKIEAIENHEADGQINIEAETEPNPQIETMENEEPIPIIIHALDKVNRVKRFQSLFEMSKDSTEKDCSDCAKKLANMRYGQCNSKNDYLEKELENTAESRSVLGSLIRTPLRTNSVIKSSCMKTSLDLGSVSYRSCSGKAYGSRVSEPCQSEKYFKLITNSFDVVSTCMKDYVGPKENNNMRNLDIRAVYALINLESGFQINAVSYTGAGGIGQFTSAAIKDVNQNHISAVKKTLQDSSLSICKRIANEMLSSAQPIRSEKSTACERISITDGNPVKNMIYTFAEMRGLKDNLDIQIFKNKKFKDKFELSEYDIGRVKRALMVWSHNTGLAGTLIPAKALLRNLYQSKKVTDADKFINEMQNFMQKFPASANRSAVRRKETSKYFPRVTSILNQIETNVGNGTCVN